jgi:hypothetical protein
VTGIKIVEEEELVQALVDPHAWNAGTKKGQTEVCPFPNAGKQSPP